MKKSLLIILTVVLSIIILNGCLGKKAKTDLGNQEQKQVNNIVESGQNAQLAEAVAEQAVERPIAVMIDNEGVARTRHAGLDKAYAIYEIVAEGGETRFLALFKGVNVENIGPVRSTRHYFIQYAMEHAPIFVHFGWSPLAQKAIPRLRVNNINGLTGIDGGAFWRIKTGKRGDWQNAFTSTERIKKLAVRKKYKDKTDASVFRYSPTELDLTEGSIAKSVKIPYAYSRVTNYKYDETNKLYKRFLGTKPHNDSVSEIQYSAKNIIIVFVKSYRLNDGPDSNGIDKDRQQVDAVGKGKGYFITNGKFTEISWEKSGETAKSIYRDKNGNEITLNKGQVWIQIVPLNDEAKVEIN